MAHIELKRNTWFARLTIPTDVRSVFGKLRFTRTTGTSNEAKACLIAKGIVSQWKLLIEQARGASGDQQLIEALRWREQFQLDEIITGEEDADTHSLLLDRVEEIQATGGYKKAKEYYGLARGEITSSNVLYDQWRDQLDVVQKTKDQYIKDVQLFIGHFNTLDGINKQAVSIWIHRLMNDVSNPISKISANRILGSCRNYWAYLQNQFVITVDNEPLKGILQVKKGRKAKKGGFTPFEPDEVVTVWNAAKEEEDADLADLIEVCAYTGARIEELCSIKTVEIKNSTISIPDAKTKAGIRIVPIHSALVETVERLIKSSNDGYLISGLTFNKYDDRSNAIGKRFGRLKKKLGFPSDKVFHSIRKTFVTQLENAGLPEGIVADIVGHEKNTMTYGLYSGGATLAVKKNAIENVKYDWPGKGENHGDAL